MEWIKKHLGELFAAIIAGILLLFFTDWYNERKNELRFLDYYVAESSGLLNSVKTFDDSVHILVNAKPVQNLSGIDINIYNNTDRDYSDVPIYLDLYNANGSSVKIIKSDFFDHNRSKESIKISPVSHSINKNGIRLGYTIKTVNRNPQPILNVRFLFEGGKVPEYRVQTNKAGLDIRKFNVQVIEESVERRKSEFIRNILVTVMALSVILLATVYRSAQRRRQINHLLLQHLEEVEKKMEQQEKLLQQIEKGKNK